VSTRRLSAFKYRALICPVPRSPYASGFAVACQGWSEGAIVSAFQRSLITSWRIGCRPARRMPWTRPTNRTDVYGALIPQIANM